MTNLQLSPHLAAEALLQRRRIRTDLDAWCTEVLRPLGFKPAAHHRLLIHKLQALANGTAPKRKLMVLMPPGSAKSTYASDLFPAWFLAQRPNLSVIAASNTADLAGAFSRRVRGRIREHSKLLGVGLGREAEELWGTTNGGQYRSAGVGASIAGFRADCVTGDTEVVTPQGVVRIDNVEIGTKAGYILSYDETTGSCAFRRVVAIARRQTNTLWRIRTAAGRVVEATGNHRFWTARGWCEASALGVGDVLLRNVRGAWDAGSLRGGEASRAASVLRACVLDASDECGAGYGGAAHVPELRRPASLEASCGQGSPALLKCLSEGGAPTWDCHQGRAGSGAALRNLRDGVSASEYEDAGALLLAGMQGYGAQDGHRGGEEPGMASWSGQDARQSAGVVRCEAGGVGSGRHAVRSLQGGRGPAGSPHQPDAGRSSAGEPRHALPVLPSAVPCGGEGEAEPDTVALVERVRRDCDVWDIQVEGTECFFAGGILVHNCGLIDDPVKSREDADSERGQAKIWDWYWSDFVTRLKPGASQVLVQTRWAEGDLGGRLEEAEGDQWEIIRLPAIAEENDPLGRASGEWLWSDDDYGFGAKLKDDFKSLTNAGRARDWAALYQQRPAPETGDYFRREWLRPVETLPPRETMRVYGASDYAVTSEGGDYTVHVVAGMDSTGRLWLLDLWRQQASADIWVDAFADLVLQWKPIGWAEETGQIRAGVGPFLDMRSRQRRAFVARTPFPTRGGDKGVRAQSIRGRIALDGLYYQKDAPWRMAMEAELMSFPAGKHDDIVDALGLLGQLLDRMTVGPAAKAKAPVKDSWQAAFERANGGGDAEGDWKSA
jgi:predicted phage terminase large subunit-like protein